MVPNYALCMADDLTTQILIEIRDGIHQTNARLDRTNERLDRVVQEQIRHATAIVSLEKGQQELANGQRDMVKALARINDELHGLNERLEQRAG